MGIAMSSWYSASEEEIIPSPATEEDIGPKNISEEEKAHMANKRIAYLSARYPPTKPLDKTKRVNKAPKDDTHHQYIKDVCS